MIKEKNQIFKCEVCGNMVEAVHTGNGDLVCCGEPMKEMSANTQENVDTEKHLPVVEMDGNLAIIKIGSKKHPMTPEHYIEWVEVIAKNKVHRRWLKPGMEPETTLTCKADEFTVRVYCNLHGIWSIDVKR